MRRRLAVTLVASVVLVFGILRWQTQATEAPDAPTPNAGGVDQQPPAPLADPPSSLQSAGTAKRSVRVLVRTPRGPVPRATLLIHHAQDVQPVRTAETGPDGTVLVEDLNVGQWVVRCAPPGFIPGEKAFDIPPSKLLVDVDLLLAPSGILSGIVRLPTGADHATIRVVLIGPAPNSTQRLLRTDDMNAFSVSNLDPGSYSIRAVAVGGDRTWGGEVNSVSAEGHYDVRLNEMDRPFDLADINGVVVLSDGGPCPNARVWWKPGGYGRETLIIADNLGAFVIPAVPLGPYQLTASHPFEVRSPESRWNSDRTKVVQAGDASARIVVTLGPAFVVSIRGANPEHTRVSLIAFDVPQGEVVDRPPDPDGEYRFWGVPAVGFLSLFARSDDFLVGFVHARFDSAQRESTLEMRPGVEIEGVILLPGSENFGTRDGSMDVFATGMGFEQIRVLPASLEAGRFRFRGLTPVLWRIVARISATSGGKSYEGATAVMAPAQNVQLIMEPSSGIGRRENR